MRPMILTAASHQAAHGDPLTLVLLALLALIGWGISLLWWPWKSCPRCGGTRLNRGSTRRRFGMCRACAGTGRRRRLGATTVHRLYWSTRSDRLHDQHRRRLQEIHDQADHPEL